MADKQTEAILRNEGIPKRKKHQMPSGTFTHEMSPTIALDLIGVKVAEEVRMKRKVNPSLLGGEIVEILDHLRLLPSKFTKDQKVKKVCQYIAWMVTKQPNIPAKAVHSYVACRKSYNKAMASLKLASKN